MKRWKTYWNRPFRIMLISMALLFLLVFGLQWFKHRLIKQVMLKSKDVVVTVSAIPVQRAWWQPKLLSYGSLRAVKGVNVTTELSGLVEKIYFVPGTRVKTGTVLVQLNADSDKALLKALEAQEKLAEIVYCRDKAQFSVKAISKATLDADKQNLKNLKAQVAQQAAIVAKKTLLAPFSGRLGISVVNPGQYLNEGDTVVTLQDLDKLYADFYIPQQNLGKLHVGAFVQLTVDTYPNKIFTGKVTTINPIVDANTRNIEVEATLVNRQHELYPGMFISAEVQAGPPKRVLILPQSAISYNSYGEIVYILKQKAENYERKPTWRVLQTFVKTGDRKGDQVIILDGVKAGDKVVTSGQLKLKNNSLVTINNRIMPDNNSTPRVKEDQ